MGKIKNFKEIFKEILREILKEQYGNVESKSCVTPTKAKLCSSCSIALNAVDIKKGYVPNDTAHLSLE